MNGDFGARNRREPAAWGRVGGLWQESPHAPPPVEAAMPAPSSKFAPAAAAAVTCGSRDRTGEFRAVVTQFRGGVATGGFGSRRRVGPPPAASSTSADAARFAFSQRARHIGADLAQSGAKLAKLSLLEQHYGRGPEWLQLAQIVGQDVTALNHAIAALQEAARLCGSHGSGPQVAAHCSAVVLTLQTRLAEITGRYCKATQQCGDKLPARNPPAGSNPPPSQSGCFVNPLSVLSRSASDVSIDMSAATSQQQQSQAERNDRELTDRADSMRAIEQTMVDLGCVFQQLATIVQEQDELVRRIGASVDETALNVEVAHEELLKFFKSLTSNRSLMMKVFGLLVVFFILFVVFLR